MLASREKDLKVRIDRKKRIGLFWAVPVLTALALGGAQGAPAMGRGPGNGLQRQSLPAS